MVTVYWAAVAVADDGLRRGSMDLLLLTLARSRSSLSLTMAIGGLDGFVGTDKVR